MGRKKSKTGKKSPRMKKNDKRNILFIFSKLPEPEY
jgi:hypothetical protein